MNGNSGAQIVLITGAGSGFGRTTAIELARAGHIVYASMRRDDLEGHSKERWAGMRSVASEERLDLRPLELDVRRLSLKHADACPCSPRLSDGRQVSGAVRRGMNSARGSVRCFIVLAALVALDLPGLAVAAPASAGQVGAVGAGSHGRPSVR
jgi:NAD(P)-dependent dehydrogenase (short-subunit alcohol dehydrogenase family)